MTLVPDAQTDRPTFTLSCLIRIVRLPFDQSPQFSFPSSRTASEYHAACLFAIEWCTYLLTYFTVMKCNTEILPFLGESINLDMEPARWHPTVPTPVCVELSQKNSLPANAHSEHLKTISGVEVITSGSVVHVEIHLHLYGLQWWRLLIQQSFHAQLQIKCKIWLT